MLAINKTENLVTHAIGERSGVVGLARVDNRQFVIFDITGTFVFFTGTTVEEFDVDDGSFYSRGNFEGGVFYVTSLVAKDGAQELLFGGQLGFTFGGDFTDQNIVRFYMSANADNTAGVKVAQHVFANVGNIAGHFFGSKLGITSDNFKFFNMNGGKSIFFYATLGNEDGVFKVITAPGHEGHGKVFAKSQLAAVDAGAVCQNVTFFNGLTGNTRRFLAKAGVLVRFVEFLQNIGAHAARFRGDVVSVADNDTVSVGITDNPVAFCQYAGTGVLSHVPFHSRANDGAGTLNKRHCLTLHVGTHERAVGIVMLKERNKGRGDGHHLAWRNVNESDIVFGHVQHVAADSGCDVFFLQRTVLTFDGVGLGNDFPGFAGGVQINDFFCHLAIFDNAVRRFNEAKVVDASVCCQGNDKSDVRAFRRFNGADTSVVGGVYVTHFKACALTSKTAGSKGGKTTLVRYFRQGVGLVHELGELGGAKELFQHSRYGLGVDKVVGHEGADFLQAHAFFNGTLHADKANAVLVFNQFANGTHTAVAEVVNVVSRAMSIFQMG